MKQLVVVDADHTIREPLSGNTFAENPGDQVPINRWIFKEHPRAIFVALSNQAGVEAGHKTMLEAIEESQITLDQQPELDRFMFVADFNGKEVVELLPRFGIVTMFKPDKSFRKPSPEGLLYYMNAYNVNKEDTIMYGDREDDFLAAEAAGVDFKWINNS